MWLLVAAPTISRVLPAHVAMDAGMAHMGHAMPGMDDMAMPDMAGMPHAPDEPGDPGHSMDQCGHCALLAHTPLLAGGFIAVLLATPLPAQAPVSLARLSWLARPLLSAHPRGPPAARLG